MSRSIIVPHFARQLKRYAKKYASLIDDVRDFLEHFDKRSHASLGTHLYKARLKVRAISRGSSSSFRLIVLLSEHEKYIVPITLYFKGDQKDISRKEINDHLEIILFELRLSNSL